VVSSFGVVARLKDKIVLHRYGGSTAKPLCDAPGDTHVASYVTFDEAACGVADQEVAPALSRSAKRVSDILNAF
jgi:hypothetical protein